MNKIIFQVGLLAFCVATVFFGTQELSLIELVSRSFIVFIGIMVCAALILAISMMFVNKEREHSTQSTAESNSPAKNYSSASKATQTATAHSKS
jgi:hypothetical protein